MKHKPTIIFFWSYKGGQGRTWACANMALELALFQGAKVLLIDFDYRAPGLRHYFIPFTDIKTESTGFVEGLQRWYNAYNKSFKIDPDDTKFFDANYFKQMIDKYKFPDTEHEIFPFNNWEIGWGTEDPVGRILGQKTPCATGGFIDVLTEIDFVNPQKPLKELLDLDPEKIESLDIGNLWLAHCGNTSDEIFRKYYGEGYPWRALADPTSANTQDLPITFANAFYSAASLLSDYCEAEYVFVDMPAGVTNITEQLIVPIYENNTNRGRYEGNKDRFNVDEPSGLIAVTTLSSQALEGTANFFTGQLFTDGEIPLVCRKRRALVFYNNINKSMGIEVGNYLIKQNADLCKISKAIKEDKNKFPEITCFQFPDLSSMEFLFRLKLNAHPAFKNKKNPLKIESSTTKDDIKKSFDYWTNQSSGYLARLRRTGNFWSEYKIPELINPPDTIVIFGENVPSFDIFIDLLTESLSDQKVRVLMVYKFDHTDLFNALKEHSCVEEFKQKFRMPSKINNGVLLKFTKWEKNEKNKWTKNEEAKTCEFTFEEIFELSDAVIIPHYLHGYLFAKGLLEDLSVLFVKGEYRDLKERVYQFEEFCEYRNTWISLPFTALAKILYSKEKIPYKRYKYSDLARIANIELSSTDKPWILTESKRSSLSLWYEWEQLLLSRGESLFEREKGNDVAKLMTNEDKNKKNIFKTVKFYWDIIRSQRETHRGKIDWNEAGTIFVKDKSYKFWLGWSDWSDKIFKKFPERNAEITFLPMPLEEISSTRQPLEGWVISFPTKKNEEKQKLIEIAKIFYCMMADEVQSDFLSRGGCSAFKTVLNDRTQNKKQQWIESVKETLEKSVCKGKTSMMPSYAHAVIAFLDYTIFGTDEYISIPGSETELKDRFDLIWDEFYETLVKIRKEEMKTS